MKARVPIALPSIGPLQVISQNIEQLKVPHDILDTDCGRS